MKSIKTSTMSTAKMKLLLRNVGIHLMYALPILLLLLDLSSASIGDSSLMSSQSSQRNVPSNTRTPQQTLSSTPSMPPEVVCSSVEVRNYPKQLPSKLGNCTVIEGYLKIVLMDKANPEDFLNMSFPALREVTDFVLFFAVRGLHSIGRLFPNLSFIRGQRLYYNYAFVVYELGHLTEIDLQHLTTIERGAVRIEKNPNLCHTDTIDWDLIATSPTSKKRSNVIRDNKKKYACKECMKSCPKGQPTIWNPLVSETPVDRPSEPLCWTPDHCQRVCTSSCGSRSCLASNPNVCCDTSCLGGCYETSDNRSTSCIACRGVRLESPSGDVCVEKCPVDRRLIEFRERRCINESTCRQTFEKNDKGVKVFYKSRGTDNKCLLECPPGYENDPYDENACSKCAKGICQKTCPGGVVITSISDAKKFTGCTTINGSLAISVKGTDDVVSQLESSLRDVHTIKGFLKIQRSPPLVSLHFFKSLHTIEGNILDRLNYSLLVYDNPNLKELFNWDAINTSLTPVQKSRQHVIEIKRGKVYFHTNPKLCTSKIDEIKTKTSIKEWSDNDVSATSNGDKAACNVIKLDLNVTNVKHDTALINWENVLLKLYDNRFVVEYVIYYREVPENTTVNKYDGRDACNNRGWSMTTYEVVNYSDKSLVINTQLEKLKPFTRYAVYVTTYTISSASQGGESEIEYFKTLPTIPGKVAIVMAKAVSENSINVLWENTKFPNGIVTFYRIKVMREQPEEIDQDFCEPGRTFKTDVNPKPIEGNPVDVFKNMMDGLEKNTKTPEKDHFPVNNPDFNQCYTTCKAEKTVGILEEEISEKAEFQDAIYEHEFKKMDDPNRSRRSVNNQEENEIFSKTNRIGHNIWTTHSSDPSTVSTEVTTSPTFSSSNNSESDARSSNFISTSETSINTTFPFEQLEERVIRVNVTPGKGFENMTIGNLTHYSSYIIRIEACHDPDDPDKPDDVRCSGDKGPKGFFQTKATTHRSSMADVIRDVNVTTSTSNKTNEIIVRWKEPERPNGNILTFNVRYGKPGKEPTTKCIGYADYKNNGHFVKLSDLSAGEYRLEVRAYTEAGPGNWSSAQTFTVVDKNQLPTWMVLLYIFGGIVAVIFFSVVSSFIIVKKNRRNLPSILEYISMNPEYMPAYEPDDWEISRDKVVLLDKPLGQGGFGRVIEGYIKDFEPGIPQKQCAIKMVNQTATSRDKLEFLHEASIMKSFDCYHVTKLLGIVSVGSPILVCMELMPLGDLKNYLRSCRPEYDGNLPKRPEPTKHEIHLMACQIADGMAYLAAKKFTHRDLACRNCLIAADKTVKIGDFGMTRDIYTTDYYRKGGKGLMPVRWLAPESIRDGVHDTMSDVWSFGVVLWEMVTLAEQPYTGLLNPQVWKYVSQGGTIDRPENCPEDLWTIMFMCWAWKPKARPTFGELIDMLYGKIHDTKKGEFESHSFYLKEKNAMSQTSTSAVVPMDYEEAEESTPLNPESRSRPIETSAGSETVNSSGVTIQRSDSEDADGKGSKESSMRFLPSILQNTLSRIPFFSTSSSGSVSIGENCNESEIAGGDNDASLRAISSSTSTTKTAISARGSLPVGETSFNGVNSESGVDDDNNTQPGSTYETPKNGNSRSPVFLTNGFSNPAESDRNCNNGNVSNHNDNSNSGIPIGGATTNEGSNSKASMHSNSDGSKGSKVSNGSAVNGWNPHKTSIC